jgi:hypothetical protein
MPLLATSAVLRLIAAQSRHCTYFLQVSGNDQDAEDADHFQFSLLFSQVISSLSITILSISSYISIISIICAWKYALCLGLVRVSSVCHPWYHQLFFRFRVVPSHGTVFTIRTQFPIPHTFVLLASYCRHRIPVSGLGNGSRRFPSSPVPCLAFAVTVRRRCRNTQSMSAVTSSHFRSSLQDHTTLNPASTSHDRRAPLQPSSPSPYPPRSPIVSRPHFSRRRSPPCTHASYSLILSGMDSQECLRWVSGKITYLIKVTNRNLALLPPSIQKVPNTP